MAKSSLLQAEPLESQDGSLRPVTLREFIGQTHLKKNLRIFLTAAHKRAEPLEHVLFHGPPGLGKTTLAHIIAEELKVGLKVTSGPILIRPGDLAALLTNLQPRDVLFIDEIHRLSSAVEEVLYPAMEDFKLDLMIGEGPAARSLRIDLPPFTLIGATTRSGLLTQPLRERFGIPLRLAFYNTLELKDIVLRQSLLLNCPTSDEGAHEIAKRSRGTPRVAGRLLRRVRDFATVAGNEGISLTIATEALEQLEVDAKGLDAQDHRYLRLLADTYEGGPAGIETMAAALGEQKDTLEDVVEPYLLQMGLLQRTPRGRILTADGLHHLRSTYDR